MSQSIKTPLKSTIKSPIRRIDKRWRERLSTDNGSKLLALFLALILWTILMSRKQSILTKEFSLDFLLKPHLALKVEKERKISLKFQGPKPALKKISQLEEGLVLTLDQEIAGVYKINISKEGLLDLPLGTKIISIEPEVVSVSTKKREESINGNNE